MSNRNIYAAARNAAGLTQERAAECLAVSVRSLADYESGVRLPSEEVAEEIARQLRAMASNGIGG